MSKQARVLIGLVFVFGLYFQFSTRWVDYKGDVFGTTFHFQVKVPRHISNKHVRSNIDTILNTYNSTFSTYQDDTEISKINVFDQSSPISISELFYDMTNLGISLHEKTSGLWDGTVFPLVDLWGFYDMGNLAMPTELITSSRTREPSERTSATSAYLISPPSATYIQSALETVGFDQVFIYRYENDYFLKKQNPHLQLDYSSIAKGGAVDAIADYVDTFSDDFMIEIGGEVFLKGNSKKRKSWAIGIQHPRENTVYAIVTGDNVGIATSGDYERFFVHEGQRYSHVINPKTGWPVKQAVVSATVVSPSTAYSDGLASGLMGMTPSEAISLVNSLDRVECFVVGIEQKGSNQESVSDVSSESFSLINHTSNNWKNHDGNDEESN